MNNKQTKTEHRAEQIVADLQRKRSAAAARVEEIAIARGRLGFAVHATDDKAARAQLDKLNAEDTSLAGELQSLDGALTEATRLLAAARQAAARDARRAEIAEGRARLKEFRELGPFLDRSVSNLQRGLQTLRQNAAAVGKDHRHIFTLHRVLAVAFSGTPFKEAFPVPDSNDRRSFASFALVINAWCDNFDANLARELQALDDKQTTEAA
jgi:hypothetical protein